MWDVFGFLYSRVVLYSYLPRTSFVIASHTILSNLIVINNVLNQGGVSIQALYPDVLQHKKGSARLGAVCDKPPSFTQL